MTTTARLHMLNMSASQHLMHAMNSQQDTLPIHPQAAVTATQESHSARDPICNRITQYWSKFYFLFLIWNVNHLESETSLQQDATLITSVLDIQGSAVHGNQNTAYKTKWCKHIITEITEKKNTYSMGIPSHPSTV